MKKLFGLIKRNLLVYFKDRTAVLFSMITPIIILALYLLFLKGNYVNAIKNAAESLRDFITDADIEAFSNGILLVGILGAALITIPFNSLSTIIHDKESRIIYDMSATPVSRVQIILAYFIASSISAFIITGIILTAGLVIITLQNPMYISALDIFYLYLTVLLGSVSATAILMIVMLFFKNSSEAGAFMGIVSAASGFVIGAYIPISEFSDGIQTFCNIFPATGITITLRNLFLRGILEHMDLEIGGVDNHIFVETMKKIFTFSGKIFGNELSLLQTMTYIIVFSIIAVIAISIIYPKVYRKR